MKYGSIWLHLCPFFDCKWMEFFLEVAHEAGEGGPRLWRVFVGVDVNGPHAGIRCRKDCRVEIFHECRDGRGLGVRDSVCPGDLGIDLVFRHSEPHAGRRDPGRGAELDEVVGQRHGLRGAAGRATSDTRSLLLGACSNVCRADFSLQ